jgi:hypothetical protein
MKAAIYSVISLVSIFISMFTALMLLALKASETFEGIVPSEKKVLILKTSSALFFVLALTFLFLTYRGLKKIKV